MKKLCKGNICTTILSPGDLAYMCCSPDSLYCAKCQYAECVLCKSSLKKKIWIGSICSSCDGTDKLQTCGCPLKITCKACAMLRQICLICRQMYVPHSQDSSKYQTSPSSLKTICPTCERLKSACTCMGNGSPSPIKKAQIVQCSDCYTKHEIDTMFCNICGHFFCKNCVSKLEYCPQTICKTPIQRSMVATFLDKEQCLMCQEYLPQNKELRYGPDKNICQKCKSNLDEPEPPIIKAPEPPKVVLPPSNIKPPASLSKEKRKDGSSERVGASPSQNVRIIKPPTSPSQKQSQNLLPPPSSTLPPRSPHRLENNFLSPNPIPNGRADPIARTPQKPLRSPSASKSPNSAVRDSPAQTRSKSKSNASCSDASIPLPCSLCSIPYLIKQQFLVSRCPNKHRMCRYCVLQSRTACEACSRDSKKYFSYKEISSDDKAAFNQKLLQEGYGLCWACSIVVEKSRVIVEKDKGYCRSCVLRLK